MIMSEPETRNPTALWSSGLSRSYSEQAALMLRHFDSHRGKHRQHLDGLKYTRSGPDFRHALDISTGEEEEAQAEADDEDEDEDDQKSQGRKTWRISPSASYREQQGSQQQHSRMTDIGCRGDSNDISTELSEMSLADSPSDANFETPASRKTRTTASSFDIPYRRFEEDYSNGRDNFLLMEKDCDFLNSEEMKFIDELEDDEFPGEASNDMIVINESTTSLMTSDDGGHRRLDGKPLSREISYENWATDKKREIQRRKMEQRMAEEKKRKAEELERRAREEKERRDYENYLEWVERKRREKQLKKKLREKEMRLQMRINEVEEKARLAKDICLKQWMRKKEDKQKAIEKEQILKRQKLEEEKQKRLENSLKAYEQWREKSKNAPRPATQGLLPHQKAKPAFTNPTPWQPLVETHSDDSDNGIQPKASGTTIKTQSSRKSLVKR